MTSWTLSVYKFERIRRQLGLNQLVSLLNVWFAITSFHCFPIFTKHQHISTLSLNQVNHDYPISQWSLYIPSITFHHLPPLELCPSPELQALAAASRARELCQDQEDEELLRCEAVSLLRISGAQAEPGSQGGAKGLGSLGGMERRCNPQNRRMQWELNVFLFGGCRGLHTKSEDAHNKPGEMVRLMLFDIQASRIWWIKWGKNLGTSAWHDMAWLYV